MSDDKKPWVCPRCERVCAPWREHCDCKPDANKVIEVNVPAAAADTTTLAEMIKKMKLYPPVTPWISPFPQVDPWAPWKQTTWTCGICGAWIPNNEHHSCGRLIEIWCGDTILNGVAE